jgi:hypothetical protein
MANQIAHFDLVEPIGLSSCWVTLETLAIPGRKLAAFGANLKFGDG